MRVQKFTIKKIFMFFLALILTVHFIPDAFAAAKPVLNKTSINLKEGQTYQLKLKNAKQKVSWKSKNKSVATVSQKGKVKAKKSGTAVITATCAGRTYRCNVKVQKTYLSKTELTINYGTKETIILKNAAFKTAWFSSNQKIAFCINGTIEAKSVGTAVVTAKCGGKSYSCTVHVLSGESDAVTEDGIYTSREKVAEYLRKYGKLPANFMTKAEAQNLGWSGGSLLPYAKYKCIGGDVYRDFDNQLDHSKERIYYECDINTLGALERGTERIIYSSDGLIYYTGDHYQTFVLIT